MILGFLRRMASGVWKAFVGVLEIIGVRKPRFLDGQELLGRC